VNLRCGVKIFATLASKDKTIASNDHGAARYWSVLRAGPKVEEIKELTKKNLPV